MLTLLISCSYFFFIVLFPTSESIESIKTILSSTKIKSLVSQPSKHLLINLLDLLKEEKEDGKEEEVEE